MKEEEMKRLKRYQRDISIALVPVSFITGILVLIRADMNFYIVPYLLSIGIVIAAYVFISTIRDLIREGRK